MIRRSKRVLCVGCAGLALWLAASSDAAARDLMDRVEHGYAENDGVKIHFVSLGRGPLVVMLHGFPDFWYGWRHQMEALSTHHRVVALDLRGYNRSDKPKGVENYALELLVGDVVAVIRKVGEEKAIVVGHDWGGAVAWRFAMSRPEMIEKLVILNLPHPMGMARELATNVDQQANSQYARRFQQEGSHKALTAEALALWVQDPVARKRYVEAFQRSDFEAMMNYYKQNYPASQGESAPPDPSSFPRVKVPVLMFHGLEDPFLLHQALNGTWEWLDRDLTLVTIPEAGHFVQQDAAQLVTRTMEMWLAR